MTRSAAFLFPLVVVLAACAPGVSGPAHLAVPMGTLGARVESGGMTSELGLARFGRGAHLAAVAPGRPESGPGVVRVDHGGGLVEWWRPIGARLEHLVTVDRRAAGEGPLVLVLAVAGDVEAELVDADRVALRDATGSLRARYEHLVVIDDDGARVPAHLEADGRWVRIVVEDAHAAYPIVVDPLLYAVEEATLADPVAELLLLGTWLGTDRDATHVVVGGTGTPARVFERAGTSWSLTATLPGSTSASLQQDLAMSADGDRIVWWSRSGVARVYGRSGASWSEEALLAPGLCGGSTGGSAVAINGDGTVVVLGSSGTCPSGVVSGQVAIYRRSGGTWALQPLLVPPDTSAREGFGAAVAVSGDGARIAVGSSGGSRPGGVRVYVFDGSTFVMEAQPATVGSTDMRVALDDAGVVLAIGVPNDVTIHARAGSSWTERARLADPLPGGGHAFGSALALSADGATLVVGSEQADADGSGGAAYLFHRIGTSWTLEQALTRSGAGPYDRYGFAVALARDGSRAIVGAPSDDLVSSGEGSARVFRLAPTSPIGTGCTAAAACETGFCVDGVCCESACGGSDADCQACSAALTGAADGTCAPLDAASAPTVTCRRTAGPCDAPETCEAGRAACPDDGFRAMGETCRAAAPGSCDAPETCSGASAACPADAVQSAGVACRASTGACDPAERCDGSTDACPGDVLSPAGTECGGASPRSCTTAGTCTGASGACGGGTLLPAGTVCERADPANGCDVDDVCDASGACIERWASADVACGDGPAMGACDAPDHCHGMIGACVDAFLVDVECRASRGGCDPAEVCSGDAADCPADQVQPAGIVCRASTAACDPVESCDGLAASCPADRSECVADAGAGGDAGAGADAGGITPATGCACRAGRGGSLSGLLALLLAPWLRRRRALIGVGS